MVRSILIGCVDPSITYAYITGFDRPNFKDLLHFVVPHAAAKWRDLGLELMDSKCESKLVIIEEDGNNCPQVCCRKMLSEWLSTEESPTWNKIICGLKLVGLNYAASCIETQLQGLLLFKQRVVTLTL